MKLQILPSTMAITYMIVTACKRILTSLMKTLINLKMAFKKENANLSQIDNQYIVIIVNRFMIIQNLKSRKRT